MHRRYANYERRHIEHNQNFSEKSREKTSSKYQKIFEQKIELKRLDDLRKRELKDELNREQELLRLEIEKYKNGVKLINVDIARKNFLSILLGQKSDIVLDLLTKSNLLLRLLRKIWHKVNGNKPYFRQQDSAGILREEISKVKTKEEVWLKRQKEYHCHLTHHISQSCIICTPIKELQGKEWQKT